MKKLGIPFRTILQKIKTLGISFQNIKEKKKPFKGEEKHLTF
jgi:hypothetical protein